MEGLITNYREDRSLKFALAGGIKMGLRLADIDSIQWATALSSAQWIEPEPNQNANQVLLPTENGILSVPLLETVYTRDGKKIVGRILSYRKGEELLLVNRAGEELVLKEEDIGRIIQQVDHSTLKKYLRQRRRLLRPFRYALREKGPYADLSFSTFTSDTEIEEPDETAAGFHLVYGKHWNRWVGTGLGVGLDGYDSFSSGATLLPVYVQLRGYLAKKWQAPFYALNAGYAWSVGGDTEAFLIDSEGGWMIHPAFGWRFGASQKANFTLDLGVKFQEAYIARTSKFNGDLEIRDILYRRLTVRIGLVF